MMRRDAITPRIAPGVDAADVRLRQDAALDPRRRELFADEAVVVILRRSHVQEADVLRAHLAVELGAVVDALRCRRLAEADAPAEVGLHLLAADVVAGEVEVGGAVEEEVPALR